MIISVITSVLLVTLFYYMIFFLLWFRWLCSYNLSPVWFFVPCFNSLPLLWLSYFCRCNLSLLLWYLLRSFVLITVSALFLTFFFSFFPHSSFGIFSYDLSKTKQSNAKQVTSQYSNQIGKEKKVTLFFTWWPIQLEDLQDHRYPSKNTSRRMKFVPAVALAPLFLIITFLPCGFRI